MEVQPVIKIYVYNIKMVITIFQTLFFLLSILLSYFAISAYFGDRDEDDDPEKLTRKIFWLFFTSVILVCIIGILEIIDNLFFLVKLKKDIAPPVVKTN